METARSPIEHARAARCAALVMVVCTVTTCAMPAFGAEHDEGEAYALVSSEPLCSESRWRNDNDGVATFPVVYRCPDGSPFARTHIRATTNAEAPDFDLLDARSGYTERVRGNGDAREVLVTANANALERTATLGDDADQMVAGFDAFVRNHRESLNGSGKSLAFPPGRPDTRATSTDVSADATMPLTGHCPLS